MLSVSDCYNGTSSVSSSKQYHRYFQHELPYGTTYNIKLVESDDFKYIYDDKDTRHGTDRVNSFYASIKSELQDKHNIIRTSESSIMIYIMTCNYTLYLQYLIK